MFKLLERILTLVFIIFMLAIAMGYAQAPPPGTPPAALPLDGFMVALLAGGVGYGIRKIRRKPN